MEENDLIVLGLAGVAVYMILQAQKKTATGTSTSPTRSGTTTTASKGITDMVSEILNPMGQAYDNGWRYFDNGTSISPEGDYYLYGKLVYSANTGGAKGSWA